MSGNSDKIKFHCKNCGQGMGVPQAYAGKKGKCPKCKNLVLVHLYGQAKKGHYRSDHTPIS